jgi:hypothetical protein
MKAWIGLVFGAVLLCVTPAMAQDTAAGGGGADTNMDILMQKIKADKKLLVATNMDLSDAEGKKFWPLYDEYQKELMQINQKLGKAISEYAEAYNAGKGTITDKDAKRLLHDVLSADEAELKLKRTYADKVGKVLPMTKAARFIQIENKIRAVLRAELAQQIPLVY